ncbi:regulatory protein RecX [Pedobacter sp. SYSU D00535]|uniref:regulatory protein RecX n=1 Tax=Pedobacter sp. SYSU D00535 TaxID=2810308 RepID=UPI001A970B48|nr:regulatory protein RecX [Pedobacter sp. SYSU D00535]
MANTDQTLPLDRKTALAKLEAYCAYQERSQQEVRDKLFGYGLRSAEVEELIVELIQNNFLNEERFAMAYASGKFNMKGWGRMKIKQGLKFKRVSDRLIAKALQSIDDSEYFKKLQLLLEKKERLLVEKDQRKKQYKLLQYGLGKGYEKDLILTALNSRELL